jgi:branched-chain amino acid transport system substrate-binding protein
MSVPGTQQSTTYGDPISIGVPLSLSGSLSNESGLAKQGYDLWLDWVNNHEGGIDIGGVKHPVKLVYADDQSKPDLAAQLAEAMIAKRKVRFLLGPYGATNTAAVAAVADRQQVPMISANGSASSIFTKGYKYVFGVQTPAAQNLQGVIDMALTLKPVPATMAVLSSDDAFSLEVAKGATEYAASKGIRVVFNRQYPSGSTNLYDLLAAAKDQNPDILINSGHLIEAVAITKSARDIRFNAKLFVYTVGPSMPPFVKALGNDANFVVTGSQWTAQAQYKPAYYLSVPQYVSTYRQKFNTTDEPNYQTADATAAGLALEKAIENAQSLKPDKVRSALAALDLMTFYGRIKFNGEGWNAYKPMLVEQIQNNHRVTVFPTEMAASGLMWPTPGWAVRDGIPVAPDAKLPQTGLPPGSAAAAGR